MRALPLKATHQQTRTYNQQLVLKTIYDHGQISRAEVARLTKLTRVTVSEIVSGLLEKGIVAEVGRGPSAGGKTPILLSVVDDAYHLIGVDLASDELHGAVVNLYGDIRYSLSIPLKGQNSAQKAGQDSALEGGQNGDGTLFQVYSLIDALIASTDNPILGIGIGTPGLLDTTRGVVRRAVNLGWIDLPLGSLLQARYQIPVYIANDSQVTALAEHIFGGGRGDNNLAVIKVGRGIGAGIILNGQLFQGDGSGAGEIGHIGFIQNGELCRCGNVGCIETIGSALAIVRRVQSLVRTQSGSLLNQTFASSPSEITFEEILKAFEAGDPLARQVALEAGHALGFAAACLINLLNMRRILLVGSVTRFGQPWLDAVREEMIKHSLTILARETEVSYGELGENAVILGASALLLTRELGLSLVR
jgi:predicted NBD/HSP70 family sugar kinase